MEGDTTSSELVAFNPSGSLDYDFNAGSSEEVESPEEVVEEPEIEEPASGGFSTGKLSVDMSWLTRTEMVIAGMDPMISYTETTILSVDKDQAYSYRMRGLDASGNETFSQELEIKAEDLAGGDSSVESPEYEEVELEVSGQTFRCYYMEVAGTRTWVAIDYPGLTVRMEGDTTSSELVAFNPSGSLDYDFSAGSSEELESPEEVVEGTEQNEHIRASKEGPEGYFSEDFENPNHDWSWLPEGVELENGAIAVDPSRGFFMENSQDKGKIALDLERLTRSEGTEYEEYDQIYEIYFHWQDADNYYKLQIRSDGMYRVGKRKGGVWSVLKATKEGDYLPIDGWDQNASKDNIKVLLNDNRFTFYCNGKLLSSAYDPDPFAGGGIGIYTGGKMAIAIDSLSFEP